MSMSYMPPDLGIDGMGGPMALGPVMGGMGSNSAIEGIGSTGARSSMAPDSSMGMGMGMGGPSSKGSGPSSAMSGETEGDILCFLCFLCFFVFAFFAFSALAFFAFSAFAFAFSF